MDLQLINQLITTVTSSNLRSFEVEENGFRLRLENNPQLITDETIKAPNSTSTQNTNSLSNISSTDNTIDNEDDENNYIYITAPLVGIYYPLSALNKENLKPGDPISAGSIVCAIEAMKLINEVKCDEDGIFVESLVEEGAEVEYGQKLLKIRKAGC